MEFNQISCPLGTMSYTIVAGDSFYSVARTFGIAVESIIAANPGVNPDRLFIGQVICVPGICSYGTLAYMIKERDTLYSIAIRFKTTVDAIVKQNPGINPNNLNIGEVICIPQ